ncbi:MAG: alpha-amylase family glycosyl hydrolase [Gammaproteobacteria bacterium]|nr:alpha-amylase family glycosyl hydrolase [Gammaproteobacteria bacterium]
MRTEGADPPRRNRRRRYERRLAVQLALLYRPDAARRLATELLDLARPPTAATVGGRGDAMLIVYADSVVARGRPPLETLGEFTKRHIGGAFGRLHVLPFFPSSSDDGFAVIDYRRVDHRLGDWENVRTLTQRYDTMFDLVINHCSRESLWFADFVGGRDPGRHYFITLPEESDTSAVVRPRTSPLVSAVHTYAGIRHVWNTFSDDQVDLDFTNPAVLREFADILFFYVAQGARLIRLDAIAFLWKRLGTSCMSLPETHAVVRIMRLLLDYARAGVRLLTETNVPHEENVSYFGDGDEAHMVYQFSLSPLLLYSYAFGNASYLTAWAARLAPPPDGCTYANMFASHDGIGLRPLEGLVPDGEVARLVERMHERGGFVTLRQASRRETGDGLKPSEMNIAPFSAFGGRSGDLNAYLAAHTLLVSFQGVPAIYIHSLLATPNDLELVEATGRTRSINRGQWQLSDLEERLADPSSDQSQALDHFKRILALRSAQEAFGTAARQRILPSPPGTFIMRREGGKQAILVIASVLDRPQRLPRTGLGIDPATYVDLLSGSGLSVADGIPLGPHQVLWLDVSG